ncbi:MAG: hypothetical protein LBE18_07760 [Planctomycetaceae bacterium]|nr:hypothetical protein [Planctomycetaceae bacterium]
MVIIVANKLLLKAKNENENKKNVYALYYEIRQYKGVKTCMPISNKSNKPARIKYASVSNLITNIDESGEV